MFYTRKCYQPANVYSLDSSIVDESEWHIWEQTWHVIVIHLIALLYIYYGPFD